MFRKSTYCGTDACIEVSVSAQAVRIRHSRDHTTVIEIPGDRWKQLVASAKTSGTINPTEWFGELASRFTPQEAEAFRLGVNDGEFDLA